MAFTKAQLEALKNSLLASNQPILASQHRQQIQSIIDEMYDAQSRANILVGVQSDSVQGGSDTFLVFRSGQAYQLPVSLLNANDLSSLGDVFINNLEDGDSLVYDSVANRWENRNISIGFALSNLSDVQLTSLAGGDILRYDSGDDLWKNVSLASLLAPYALLTDLDDYQLLSEKGQPNGYASLDTGGKVPLSQINDAILGQVSYQGTWNASTNTPTLANPPSSATKGNYYVVSVGGTFAGLTFQVGDWIISNGTAWEKVNNTDAVRTVFGRLGDVVANASDYASFYVTINTTQTISGAKTFGLDTTINGIQIGRGAGNLPDNTRIGFNALSSNTTGSNNTASGYEALLSNTNGNSNTANGFSAGRSNTSGSNNVFIGNQSLVGNTTGNLNTAIGNNAGRFIQDGITVNTITNNSVFLGANSRSLGNNESNQIVIGHNAIGKGSNTATIGNSSIISTHLSGNIHASKSTTNEAILSYSNTAVRTYTLPNASGTIALTSDLNAYLPLTGGTVASSGSTNTLNINHASGSGIALNITKGGNGEALTVVKTSGLGLVASFTGGETLISELQTTTKIADQYIESAITWNGKIGGSGTLNFIPKFTPNGTSLGNSQIFDNGVYVGIGTPSPTHLLDVRGLTILNGLQIRSTGDGSTLVGGFLNRSFWTGGSIDNNLAIGSYTGAITFFTANSGTEAARIASNGAVTINNLGTGTVYSNAGVLTNTNPSDLNLKENINKIEYGLNEILQLNPVTFHWKNDTIEQGKQYGFIAQEVQDVMPDLVKEGDYLGLDKEAIFTILVKGIQELKNENDSLKDILKRNNIN
jgi:hypothetical protein